MATTFYYNDRSPTTVTDSTITSSSRAAGTTLTLTSVDIGPEVTSIYDYAFQGCTSVTSIVIPNSVTYLGDGAFDGCTNLSSVSIGTGVTGFSYLLFQNCTSLINLTVPSNILIISPESFYGCLNLTNINIDSNNPNYTSVDGVVFNKNITTLVLYPIGKIGSYSIPNTVTSIGGESFLNCTNLTNITIPDSVTSILYYAFSSCTGLTSVNIPNSVTSIGETAFGFCSGLTTLIIGRGVTSIANYVFYGCTALTRVTIPNTVTSIGQQAFRDCTNLNNITIPKNVTTIGTQTFMNCTSLTRVNFLGNAPSLGTDIFLNTNVNLKVYRYSTKSGWSSTFGGEDVLLIDSGTRGLRSFGFGSSSSGQASVKKTNVGSGKLRLSKFDPKNISNIESWTSQGNLDTIYSYNIAYVSYTASYSGGDIDTTYYPDDNTYRSYTGEEFGFTIVYSDDQGVWYLIDPNTENDIAYAEDLLAGSWFTYDDLEYFEMSDYEYYSNSSTDLNKSTWFDISGKNNNLITRYNPASDIISTNTLNNLSRKLIGTPLKTNSPINFINPFTIYIALSDTYVGSNTRKIFGMNSFQNVGPYGFSQLYLESTTSGINHIFTLKFYSTAIGFTGTICSLTLNKVLFASDTYGPSILKLSSDYQTNSSSGIRNMTLTYYNRYSDVSKTLGSLSASGSILLSSFSSDNWLYLGNYNFGYDGISPSWLRISEFIMYSKFLNATEDGSINRYLQRKYYGKLLS